MNKSNSAIIQKILELFNNNVKLKKIELIPDNLKKHCGLEGHWLEKQMGIKPNSKNEADLLGFEMKKHSKTSKITFGDYSASEYLFSKKKPVIMKANKWEDHKNITVTRNQFIQYFGTAKETKNNRYSWSGSCVPKYSEWNSCGQRLIFNEQNDLCIYYSFEKDNRENKNKLPDFLKTEYPLLIAIWLEPKLRKNINQKFNQNGFFICKKENGVYNKICFGKPFNFEQFVIGMKNKEIIFDSGMYEGNTRNYSQFRSPNGKFWESLIVEEF